MRLSRVLRMVKFSPEPVSDLDRGRRGIISEWGGKEVERGLDTPDCMLYTRRGAIPHLTWDLALNVLKEKMPPQMICSLSLPHTYVISISSSESPPRRDGRFSSMINPLL